MNNLTASMTTETSARALWTTAGQAGWDRIPFKEFAI
jgi:hypothetical protein